MATTRTHNVSQNGPVTCDIRLTAGRIWAEVGDYDHARVEITTADDDGPSADAVNHATINERSGRLEARVELRGTTIRNLQGDRRLQATGELDRPRSGSRGVGTVVSARTTVD